MMPACRCACFIIPPEVLRRFASDPSLPPDERRAFADAARLEAYWRRVRSLQTPIQAQAQALAAPRASIPAMPAVTVFDCEHTVSLPGRPVTDPARSQDATARRVHTETVAVAKFLREAFGRHSIDDQGMTIQSSIHYGSNYNNAFWNGSQMTYGDGDGNIFVDFTLGQDVIGHEIAHGLTQFTARLGYRGEAGGLNESVSDVFGVMFRHWRDPSVANRADWRIGAGIMGPGARERGFTCLRDMADPGGQHCLSPQPAHFSAFRADMDPHESSGIPNLAFSRASRALDEPAWTRTGRIWYEALTRYAPSPNMKMKTFAQRTRRRARESFPTDARVVQAVDEAWRSVGL